MATTSTAGSIPASELIHRLPPSDEIRSRLQELQAEVKALRTLLYAAEHADRGRAQKIKKEGQRE